MAKNTRIRKGAVAKIPTQNGDRFALPDNSVATENLQDLSVTTEKLSEDVVDQATAVSAAAADYALIADTSDSGNFKKALVTSLLNVLGSSIAANGYIILPHGLYIQWGTGTAAGNNVNQTITFPIAFPTACFMVVATSFRTTQTNDDGFFTLSNFTTTDFQATSNTTAGTFSPTWIAIGN